MSNSPLSLRELASGLVTRTNPAYHAVRALINAPFYPRSLHPACFGDLVLGFILSGWKLSYLILEGR